MTREEAKKEVEKVFEPAFANYIIKALTDGATESDVEPQEWISIKDRLPTKRGRYWITLEYTESGKRVVDEEVFNEENGNFNNQLYYTMQGYKIIAWQEKYVPSPYKGE